MITNTLLLIGCSLLSCLPHLLLLRWWRQRFAASPKLALASRAIVALQFFHTSLGLILQARDEPPGQDNYLGIFLCAASFMVLLLVQVALAGAAMTLQEHAPSRSPDHID